MPLSVASGDAPLPPFPFPLLCPAALAALSSGAAAPAAATSSALSSGSAVAQARLEQLARDSERESHLELAAARPQRGSADLLGGLAQLGEQARLADARGALEEQQRSAR